MAIPGQEMEKRLHTNSKDNELENTDGSLRKIVIKGRRVQKRTKKLHFDDSDETESDDDGNCSSSSNRARRKTAQVDGKRDDRNRMFDFRSVFQNKLLSGKILTHWSDNAKSDINLLDAANTVISKIANTSYDVIFSSAKENLIVDANDSEPNRNKVSDLPNNCETENTCSDELELDAETSKPLAQTEQKETSEANKSHSHWDDEWDGEEFSTKSDQDNPEIAGDLANTLTSMDDTKADSENAWEDEWDEEPIQLAKSQAQQLLESNDQEEKCLPIQDESNQEDSNEAPMQETCPSVELTNQVSPEFANDLSNMLTALENEQNDKDLIINTNIELEDNAWEDDWDEEPIQLNLPKDPLPESSTPSETSSQLKDDLTDQTFAALKNTHKEVLQVEPISVTDDTSCIFSHAELSSPPDNAVFLENCNAPSQTPEATENVFHAMADSQQQQPIDSWGDDWNDRESLEQSDDVVQSGQSLGEFTSELLGNPPTVLSEVNPSVDTNIYSNHDEPPESRTIVSMDDTKAESENAWEDDWNEEPIQLVKPQVLLLEPKDELFAANEGSSRLNEANVILSTNTQIEQNSSEIAVGDFPNMLTIAVSEEENLIVDTNYPEPNRNKVPDLSDNCETENTCNELELDVETTQPTLPFAQTEQKESEAIKSHSQWDDGWDDDELSTKSDQDPEIAGDLPNTLTCVVTEQSELAANVDQNNSIQVKFPEDETVVSIDDTKVESENAWEDDWDEEPIQLAKSPAQQLPEPTDLEEKCLPLQKESNQEDANEAPTQEICPSVERTNEVSSEFADDLPNMLTALENEQNDNAWNDDWDEEPIQLNLQKDPLHESLTPCETSSQLKDDLTDKSAGLKAHKEVSQVEQISVTDDDNSCIVSPPDNAVPLENCNTPSQTPEATENVSRALADSQKQQPIDSWGDDWDDLPSFTPSSKKVAETTKSTTAEPQLNYKQSGHNPRCSIKEPKSSFSKTFSETKESKGNVVGLAKNNNKFNMVNRASTETSGKIVGSSASFASTSRKVSANNKVASKDDWSNDQWANEWDDLEAITLNDRRSSTQTELSIDSDWSADWEAKPKAKPAPASASTSSRTTAGPQWKPDVLSLSSNSSHQSTNLSVNHQQVSHYPSASLHGAVPPPNSQSSWFSDFRSATRSAAVTTVTHAVSRWSFNPTNILDAVVDNLSSVVGVPSAEEMANVMRKQQQHQKR